MFCYDANDVDPIACEGMKRSDAGLCISRAYQNCSMSSFKERSWMLMMSLLCLSAAPFSKPPKRATARRPGVLFSFCDVSTWSCRQGACVLQSDAKAESPGISAWNFITHTVLQRGYFAALSASVQSFPQLLSMKTFPCSSKR